MKIIYTVILSASSVAVLFILSKVMGNKQISQLTTFDYIVGITIGSIAAEMSTGTDGEFTKPLTAMIVYGLIAAALSVLTNKSLKIRRLIDGSNLILFEDGKIFKKNFKKSKLNINEFLTELRLLGYHNLADVETAFLEPNGRISVLPKSAARPPKCEEMNIIPSAEKPPVAVITDGIILKRNLKFTGNNEIWLNKQIKAQGLKSVNDIFYATCDNNNNLSVYTYVDESPDKDIFS